MWGGDGKDGGRGVNARKGGRGKVRGLGTSREGDRGHQGTEENFLTRPCSIIGREGWGSTGIMIV